MSWREGGGGEGGGPDKASFTSERVLRQRRADRVVFLRVRACGCLCTCACALETIAIVGSARAAPRAGRAGDGEAWAVREGVQGRALLFFVIKYHRDKLARGVRVRACASAWVGAPSPPCAPGMHTGRRVCGRGRAHGWRWRWVRESAKDGNGGGKVRRYMLRRVTNRGSLEDGGGASPLPLGIASFCVFRTGLRERPAPWRSPASDTRRCPCCMW